MKQISVLDDKGHMEHYPSVAAFLETLTPGDRFVYPSKEASAG